MRSNYGVYLLSFIVLTYNLIIHNPYLYQNSVEKEINITQLLLNFGWIAGLLLLCVANEVEEEKLKTA